MKKIEPSKTNKKTGIVCLGTRITLDSLQMRCVELMYMREYLLNVLKREQVDFISRKTKKEKDIDYYKDTKDTDFNDYDEIYIYNASYNPFGGLFKDEALDTFEKLYTFNGDIIYFLGDPKMPPLDFSLFLKGRDKNHTYTVKCDSKELGFIRKFDPELFDNWHDKVFKQMKVAYSGFDYEQYAQLYTEANKKSNSEFRKLNMDAEWFNFWLFEYFAVNEDLDLKLQEFHKIDEPYDLVYFGNNRLNERNKIIKNFYNIPEFKKLFIGFDPELDNTNFIKYVKMKELFDIMGKQCLSTLVVGDILHCNNVRTPRFFEAMLLDIVAFIWIEYDKDKKYVKNEFLKDFIYVSNKDELKDKINQIKNDPSLYKKIIELERKEILDEFDYMKMGSN